MHDLIRFLPELASQLQHNQVAREAFVFAAWTRSVGDGLKDKTVPLALDGQRLTVAVRDETWKKNLEEVAGQFIFKINSALRDRLVTFIEFVVDEDAVHAARSDSESDDDGQHAHDALNEVTDEMRSAAEAIKDDRLRELFLLAAGGCLARKRRLGLS